MSVHHLPVKSKTVSMRDAYHSGLADAWNAQVDVGRINREAANTMIGYLSAATIAFRVTGDETAATIFEKAGKALLADWRNFERSLRKLITELNELQGCKTEWH